ncbi:uncharacterized protein LOC123875377 isoform X2 [Maniola jurtina]|nr:uncharacterized protein LOC123875377 isoform X2 [Maniola jurtina]XP_045777120.1 uncharacterized protein LOC123875377 isoform X2 [Maniola jurtina]XP_045777121.1 uncharacterized protein LOC123875377 isoform X2 [Maniola jurtina]
MLCVFLSNYVVVIKCTPKLGSILFDPLYEANLTNNVIYQHKELRRENYGKHKYLQVTRSRKTPENPRSKSTSEHVSKAIIYVRMFNNSRKLENIKQPCLGYEFDETLCKIVEDRVVCGYNKNVGNITNKIIDFGNGCRIRGDRLECGYWQGPFNNPRRPLARDGNNEDSADKLLHQIIKIYQTDTTKKFISTTKESIKKENSISLSTSNTIKIPSSIESSLKFSIATTLSTKSNETSTSTNTMKSSVTSTSTGTTASKSTKRLFNIHCVEKNDHIFCYYIKQ